MKGLILAGGSGTRLWPLSRSHFPKQFLRMQDDESFLQKTVRRNLCLIDVKDLYIMTNASYYHDVQHQVSEIDPLLQNNVILEPECRNTAPAIAFAFEQLSPDEQEIFLITPSDHMIAPVEKYVRFMQEAQEWAEKGYLVTFGIYPTRAETGYGYIKTNGNRVEKFVEKPDLKRAQHYLQAGDYLWNSGMFLFSYGTFKAEAEKYAPELLNTPFSCMPETSIDYAIMEKSQCVVCMPLTLAWSDIGSWENVYDMLDKDACQNATQGDVFTVDTTNSLVLAKNRLVATVGLDHVLIVETEDVVMVANKEDSQKVKEVVSQLKCLGKKEVHEHVTTHRPWGSYTVLKEGARHKIKRIFVKPLEKLSLQMHYHRSEHWVVVSGTAKVTIAGEESMVHEGESIFVPKSAIHRMENPGKVDLEVIEVQVGEYLGEDDIVRFEDVYGRLKEEEAFSLLIKERQSIE